MISKLFICLFFRNDSSRYEQKIHERSAERIIENQPVNANTLPVTNPSERYAIERTNYQRRIRHETSSPYNTSVVSVTKGEGDFNRRDEMSEVCTHYFITDHFFFQNYCHVVLLKLLQFF